MKKTERKEIRLTKQDKIKCDIVLKEINKNRNKKVGYRFLLMEFVNSYLETNTKGLELQIKELNKILENEKQTIKEKEKIIKEIENKINNLDHEINNKKLYDLTNFKYNPNVLNAIDNIKTYCIDNNITSFEEIPSDLFLTINETYKIKDMDLIKNITFNEFKNWITEIKINTEKPTEKEIINLISEKVINKFNKSNKGTFNDFIKTDYGQAILKGYIKNNGHDLIKEQDIINNINKIIK